jgi:Activator of Hsp90 ATPase homolog 1-like protein
MTIEPLRLSFDLACPVEHAFAVWTTRFGDWWPVDHTVTGEPGLEVVLEPHPGGRIYERTRSGQEHDWGRVTIWEPPTRLGYLWHLRQEPARPTEVEIRFIAAAASATRVEIEHHGWEQLGADAETWRDRNRTGWRTLLPHYVSTVEQQIRSERGTT